MWFQCLIHIYLHRANAAKMIQTKQLNLEGQNLTVFPRKMNDSSNKTQSSELQLTI